MKRSILLVAILSVFTLHAQNYDVGNIAVVHGDASIASGLIGVLEQAAGQQFYMTHGDLFDFLIIYTTFTPQINMQQGVPIVDAAQGIGRENVGFLYGPASKWGSAGRLKGGVRMIHVDKYPDDPDANMAFPLAGLTSVELLAHEFSHYWLSAMDFKKEGAADPHTGLRGWEDGANQHWNHYFSSGPSVMYGSHIVDNGDGSFTFDPATPRKYGPLDQYVMGLRTPEEVGSLFFLCSYADIASCLEGSPSLPTPHTGSIDTISNMYKHEVTMDDILRAMGPRVPAAADAQHDFNAAFIIINLPGVEPFPNQLTRLETLRVRFQEWFSWATDGRGTLCTELDGDCGNVEPTDDDVAPDDTVTDDIVTDTELPDDTVIDDALSDDVPVNDASQIDDELPDTAVIDNGGSSDDIVDTTGAADEVIVGEDEA
ncbi:MAG TPA: hypothetical protein PKH10_03085, partial [bacterium]|nr:hypothetical protein [bacterium]